MKMETTPYGFIYGPIEVCRMLDDKKGVLIGLRPASRTEDWTWEMEIWVSAKGKSIRVFRKGRELK